MARINTTKRGAYWQYRFEVAKIDGKRKQVSKSGFRTKAEAEAAGNKALAEYNNSGQTFSPTEVSVADYLDYWLDSFAKMNLKYNTQLAYLNIIEHHLKPNLGKYRLKALQAATIQDYANKLKIQGYSRSHVVGILTTLSGALNYAVEPLHYIPFNPVDRVIFPKFDKRNKNERYIIDAEDIERILTRFKLPSPFYLPILLGYYTGMRVGEIFGLTWDDIDMDKRIISVNKILVKRNFGNDIRKSISRNGEKAEKSSWYFGSTKTYSSIREIAFGDTVYNALKQVRFLQLQNEMKYGEYYTKIYKKAEKDEKGETIYRLMEVEKSVPVQIPAVKYLNIKENGEMLSVDSMKYATRVIQHELKIAFNTHSLRHTHATLLVEYGADIKDIQARLGHADIQTTLNTYVHDTETMKRKTVDIFEKVMKKASAK